MPVSDILQIPVLTEAMAQKTIGVNMAIQAMEKAISGTLSIATTTATSTGFDLVIPFNTTNDLSAREALRAIYYRLLAGATHAFDLIHPNNPHLFFIKNETTQTATVKCATGSGTTVSLPAGAAFMILCDGTNMIKLDFTLVNLTQANDCEFAFYGMPEASQVMGRILIGRDTVFPANLAGSRGLVGVNPLVTHTLQLWDDATQFGTISISPSGTFTFTTTGGTARTVTAGSVLELRNSGTMDTLLDQVMVTFLATTTVAQPIP